MGRRREVIGCAAERRRRRMMTRQAWCVCPPISDSRLWHLLLLLLLLFFFLGCSARTRREAQGATQNGACETEEVDGVRLQAGCSAQRGTYARFVLRLGSVSIGLRAWRAARFVPLWGTGCAPRGRAEDTGGASVCCVEHGGAGERRPSRADVWIFCAARKATDERRASRVRRARCCKYTMLKQV